MIFLYCRVSTDQQASNGNSLAAQRERLEAYCVLQGFKNRPCEVVIDAGISGSVPLPERPHACRLLGEVKSDDVIIATKLDRLFRSVEDALVTLRLFKDRG
jgi:putative DNA-invertase from lambdoid prophage Rac